MPRTATEIIQSERGRLEHFINARRQDIEQTEKRLGFMRDQIADAEAEIAALDGAFAKLRAA